MERVKDSKNEENELEGLNVLLSAAGVIWEMQMEMQFLDDLLPLSP